MNRGAQSYNKFSLTISKKKSYNGAQLYKIGASEYYCILPFKKYNIYYFILSAGADKVNISKAAQDWNNCNVSVIWQGFFFLIPEETRTKENMSDDIKENHTQLPLYQSQFEFYQSQFDCSRPCKDAGTCTYIRNITRSGSYKKKKRGVASYGACEVISFEEIGTEVRAAVEGCSNILKLLSSWKMKWDLLKNNQFSSPQASGLQTTTRCIVGDPSPSFHVERPHHFMLGPITFDKW